MNTFGRHLRGSIMGESHGPGVGILLDGVPPGIPIDEARIAVRMQQRRPGTGPLVSARMEPDLVQIRSGILDGRTTGAPVLLWMDNQDARSQDQDTDLPRPGHADLTQHLATAGHADLRGGGHASGRLTAPLVAAAGLLEPWLRAERITVGAHLEHVATCPDDGPLEPTEAVSVQQAAESDPVHSALGAEASAAMVAAIEEARRSGDSLGGRIAWRADGVPAGLGAPWAWSLESALSALLFAVPAVKAVSFGAGVAAADMRGSKHNDPILAAADTVPSNHAGGILGGLSTGAPLWGHVTVKPTSSIRRAQTTTRISTGHEQQISSRGRHDPCIAVRAVPVVRAAVELVLLDALLHRRLRGGGPKPS